MVVPNFRPLLRALNPIHPEIGGWPDTIGGVDTTPAWLDRLTNRLSHVPIELVLAAMLAVAALLTGPERSWWALLLDVSACVAGGLARFRPVLAAAIAVLAVILSLVTGVVPGIGLLGIHLVILSWAAQGRRYTMTLAAVLLLLSLPPTALWPDDGRHLVASTIFFVMLMAGTVLLGLTWRALELRLITAQLARVEALRDLRRSIAQDLHDTVAHTDTLVAMRADDALAEPNVPPHVEQALREIADLARESIQDMRAMLHVLRADTERPAWQVTDLGDFLDSNRERLSRSGFQVDVDYQQVPAGLRPALRQALGKFLAEGINNIVKHAPPGASCTIALTHDDDQVQVKLVNDAVEGSPPNPNGLGLVGARERIEALGGQVAVSSAQGRWSLRAALPIG